ncbi:MAG TPA: DNA-3-methyladenine glycosylase I [Candidatus Norongarragalinales archaeon]|jgi:DNA-3-methyladenine glycosylase I|nr:DNA-3-methyladenine glycosylase I [Candidatus Norongarragalinales archaeon]
MMKGCGWELSSPSMVKYHDEEWGVPVHDDKKLFEFLVLEAFQAGLSWSTVLNKRENFRKAFAGFDFNKVARFKQRDVQRLLKDAGIIRNKAKILAAINNAKRFLEVRREFGTFDKYIWGFVKRPVNNYFKSLNQLPAKTPLAEKISEDLKRRGFKFVGPTIIYAHMQATGMVNDHLWNCERKKR